ncbi:hypothetical protein AAZX31_18G021400 [Glycine max]|uniref:Sororin C-terminal region domain-containing protein n=1 Tax=Glycine max TaxID=3847 RepID=K7MPG7_SOYBN|nr:uncharacterized protein LOC100807848 [Glycine max]KAG4923236.1 hypothetical protein JHK87_048776 [Glycine soja]KAH1152825.1 hypothetical protein GYH30_048772 [Glycine max]KAH1196532.1 hypothetical protein GmHk_18G050527 [Glycine max]KRG97655.1 hypothetical protein GLYMA_18G021900v4 [Glycine max]|eukprot:XP_003552150.1 uncharacterized protein LOC100807848 [Glycine max]
MKNANGVAALEPKRNPLSDLTNTNSNPSKPQSLLSSSSSSATNTTRGTVGLNVSEPISSFCSRIHALNEKKRNAKKAIANPKTSTVRDKNDGVELGSLDLTNARPRVLTVRCRKKRREQDVSNDPQMQDYIVKQKAYFKEIDEFELAEEEVESVHELD